MQPSPIVIVFVSKKTYTLLAGLGSTLFCSAFSSILFHYVRRTGSGPAHIGYSHIHKHTHTHIDTMTPIPSGSISLALALPTTDTLKRTSFVFVVVHEVHH